MQMQNDGIVAAVTRPAMYCSPICHTRSLGHIIHLIAARWVGGPTGATITFGKTL